MDDPSEALLQDVEPFGNARNDCLRFSNEEDTMMFPLIAEGPAVWGFDENGKARTGPLPEHIYLAALEPGRFQWSEMPAGYTLPPSGLLKDRTRKKSSADSPASEQEDEPVGPPAAAVSTRSQKKRDHPDIPSLVDKDGSPSSPSAKDHPKRQRKVLNLDALTQVKSPSAVTGRSTPPPKHQPAEPPREVTPPQSTSRSRLFYSILTVVVDDPPEKSSKDKEDKEKKRVYEVEDPDYVPDMDFLKQIFITTRGNASLRSPAAEYLASFSSDTFLAEDQSYIMNASLNLFLEQHASIMGLFNRHMAQLVETRVYREQLVKSGARICELEKLLYEEKKHSSKQEKKSDELRTRYMKRQMDASEATDQLEDSGLEILNLTSQINSYVTENEILSEKVETLFLQSDCLTTESL